MPSPPRPSALAHWTPEQIAAGKRWVETWRRAGEALERIWRKELRELDGYRAIAMLSGGLLEAPPSRRESSGLVEQQRWFVRARRHY